MSNTAKARGRDENPFATCYVRPGALPYVFTANHSAAGLARRLLDQGGWGQITGPHGSGKSTLLATLIRQIEQADRSVVTYALHEGQRRLNIGPREPDAWNERTQVVVDGYEQLSAFSRWRLKRLCRRRGAGLLVTAHADVGLPPLYQTRVESQVARQLVERLLGDEADRFDDQALEACLRRHPHNLREALFEMYDLYESQRIAAQIAGDMP